MPNLPSRRFGALGLVLAGAILCLSSPSEAATGRRVAKATHGNAVRAKPAVAAAPSKASAKSVADTGSVEKTGTWTSAEPEERACFRSRRKLWQAGEGWMVKTVKVCP